MSKFLDFLNESNFSAKTVEEFLVAAANSKSEFEWCTTDRDLGAAYRYGDGTFFRCLMDAEKAVETSRDDGIIATLSIAGAAIGRDIIMMYDPKTKKWSLYK